MGLLAYREARGCTNLAILAVLFVVMTRVKLGGWWGSDVIAVITHPDQFSSMTVKGDPGLRVWPVSGDPVWKRCMSLAESAFTGTIGNPVPGADSYYDTSIPPPNWATAPETRFLEQIENLRFYSTR
jgi:hypothetical protein